MAENTSTEHVVKITADMSDIESKLTKADKELDSMDSKGKKAGTTFSQLGKKLSDAMSAFSSQKATGNLNESFGDMEAKLKRIQSELLALANHEIPTQQYKNLQTELGKAEQSLTKLLDKQEKMSALGTDKTSSSWKSLQYDISKATDEVEKLESAMAEMRGNNTAFSSVEAVPTAEYTKATREAERAEQALLKLYTRQEKLTESYGGLTRKLENSRGWKSLQYDIEVAERKLEELEADVANMENAGTAFWFNIDTSQLDAMNAELSRAVANMENDSATFRFNIDTSQLDAMNAELSRAEQMMNRSATSAENVDEKFSRAASTSSRLGTAISAMRTKWQNLTSNLGIVGTAFDAVSNKLKQASQNMKEAASTASAAGAVMLTLGSALASIASVAVNVGKTILSGVVGAFKKLLSVVTSLAKSILSGLVSAFKSLLNTALNTAKKIIKAFGNAFLAPFKKAASFITTVTKSVFGLNKSASGTEDVVKRLYSSFTSLYRMLITRIKRAAVSAIFEDLTDNIGQLATVSERFNDAVSSMIDSAKWLGAQLVAAVEPIVSVVGPIISQVLDMLTAATDKLAQFTARLTGNTTYIKATKGLTDYKSTLDDATDSTEDATEATKEYQATVLGFDQLNKMADNSGSTTVDDVSTVTGVSDATLNKAETQATRLNSIADKIYQAIKNKDWATAGKTVGEAITDAFSWLSDVAGWDKNATKISNFVNNIISAVNGFTSGINGVTIGTAIGDVINSGINILQKLTDPESGIDFKAMGTKVGQILVNAMKQIDAEKLGRTIMQVIQSAMDFLNGILEENPGAELGNTIADMIGGAIDAIDPEKWSDLIVNLWRNFWDMISNIFQNPEDWAELGDKLAEMINNVMSDLNTNRRAGAFTLDFSGAFSNLSESLSSFVDGFLENVDTNKLTSLWNSIKSWIETNVLPWLESVFTTLAGYAGKAIVAALASAITAIWNGIVTAYLNFCTTVGEWVLNIGSTISSWFSGLFGNSSSSSSNNRASSTISHNANGGIIGDGQLFIANEGGTAELIGADDNGNTAVVNNQQIISAVVSGVKQGVTQALINSGMTGNSSDSGGDIVLQVDSEELARANYRGQKRLNKRTNAQVSFA